MKSQSEPSLPPPPPAPALLEAVAEMKPVKTRRPRRALAVVVVLSLAFAAAPFLLVPTRRDFDHLPMLWWSSMALVWFAGFSVLAVMALVPRSHAVIPDPARAGSAALAVASLLVLAGLTLTRDVPPYTIVPASLAHLRATLGHCLLLGLLVASGPLVLGGRALRGVVQQGGWRIGAALGAAGGALGGLTLHLLCPIGGGLHVGLAHGGGVIMGGIVGAIIGPLLFEGARNPSQPSA